MCIHYKNHLIDPKIHKLRDADGYSAEVYVFDCRQYTETRLIFEPHVFPTEERALQAAVQVGRNAINRGDVRV